MAGVSFLDLMAQRTLGSLKRQLVALCVANGLPVTSFVPGDPSERWIDITPRMVFAVLEGVATQAVRGFFLELATDPGDEGDLSADQTPRAGFLSALGEGWYGTTRRGETYSTTTVTITNIGTGSSVAIPAFGVTFTTVDAPDGPSGGGEGAKADGGRPTFRNTAAGVALAPGATMTLDIQCERIGTYGSVSANSLVLVTHSFDGAGSLSVTASGLAVGQGRESAASYRARCRLAASKLSPGGPEAAYRYAATTAADGTPLQRHDGSGSVGTTKVYVSKASATGEVTCYFADDDGAVDAVDVASANANIEGLSLGVITSPLGVVPDCITYSGSAATEVPINITATAKIKRRAGISDSALKTAAEAAVQVAWAAYFAATEIGGRDQTAGAGVIPTADLSGVVYSTALDGETAPAGLHAVAVATPSASTTPIALGHVATAGTWSITVTVVP